MTPEPIDRTVPVARSYTEIFPLFPLFPLGCFQARAENRYGFRVPHRHMLSVWMWPVQRARFRQPTFFPPQSSDRDVRRAKATVHLRPPPPAVPRSVHNLRRGSRSRTPSLLLSQLRISRRLSSRWLPVPRDSILFYHRLCSIGLPSSLLTTSKALLLPNSIQFLHTRLTVTYLLVPPPLPPSHLPPPPLAPPTLAAIGPLLSAFIISFDYFLSAHRNVLKAYNLSRCLWNQAGTKLSGAMALFCVKDL